MNSGKDTWEVDCCQGCGKQFGASDRFCGACGAVRPTPPTLVLTDLEHEQAEASGFPSLAHCDRRHPRRRIGNSRCRCRDTGCEVRGSKNAAQTVDAARDGGWRHRRAVHRAPTLHDRRRSRRLALHRLIFHRSAGSIRREHGTERHSVVGSDRAARCGQQVLGGHTRPRLCRRVWVSGTRLDRIGRVAVCCERARSGDQECAVRRRNDLHSGSSATIEIVSLVTHDARFGCRNWTGSYEMAITGGGGAWRIARANLSPESCSG